MALLRDLPVAVDLPGLLGQEVTGYVEGEAGWQVVTGGGPLAPVLALAPEVRPGPPCVVVVAGSPSAEQVRDGLLHGALDVLGWPVDRERLLEAPLRARTNGRRAGGPRVMGLAGLAGGAGTSTVALALGGLLAWSGRPTVVVGDDDLLALCGIDGWRGPGAPELSELEPAAAGAELGSLVRPVPGIEGLTVLGGGTAGLRSTSGWKVGAVVADLRTVAPAGAARAGADLVLVRPDSSLRAAIALPADVGVLVTGSGPLDRAGVRRLLGVPPVGWLPEDARVARAGVRGRVPSSLPGTWLRLLRAALSRVTR